MNGNSKAHQEGPLSFEQPFVKVPLEVSRKVFRSTGRQVDKELSVLHHASKELLNKCRNGMSSEDTCSQIDAIANRVHGLKRKLADTSSPALQGAHGRIRRRICHLKPIDSFTGADDPTYTEFSRTRLDRWLVDWALRGGRQETAYKIAEVKSLQDFVDIDLFQEIRSIESSIEAHSCQKALQWCNENKLSLKKLKSTLEFDLRLQEFIEMARARRTSDAIMYAKKHLVSADPDYRIDIEMAVGLLAYSPQTITGPQKRLYDFSRWTTLAKSFRLTAYELNSLSIEPLFFHGLFYGLASVKAPSCGDPSSKNPDCPTCGTDGLGRLAQDVPSHPRGNSTAICWITKKFMDENNKCKAFPNGYVYSEKAVETLKAESGTSLVTCPRSGNMCEADKLSTVFLS